jgi:hypothetical protein|tara:strand:+ start:61 stop:399 length:339 start_codon:yes stop_codon:yes gene_type:complete
MGWKEWNYKKRGAIVGGIIGIVSAILISTLFSGSGSSGTSAVFLLPLLIPVIIFNFILDAIGFNIPSSTSTVFTFLYILIINTVGFYLIGLLIGWIIGKIKSKKQENSSLIK